MSFLQKKKPLQKTSIQLTDLYEIWSLFIDNFKLNDTPKF
jgi:hypothetical protein